MATAHTRPDTSGASARSHASPPACQPSEVLAELLHGCAAECAHTAQALASLVELLRGCAPTHPLSAGGLLTLLEPLAGSLETLCGDLHTATDASTASIPLNH